MNKKLSIFSLFIAVCVLSACTKPAQSVVGTDTYDETSVPELTSDMGEEYIDSFIFFGESTTYHIKSRGVLRGGKDTKQVWAPKGGTVNLDTTIAGVKIVYPETGEEITVGEAVRIKKPQRILLTFGLNGAVQKVRQGEKYFRSCYMMLIEEIRKNSPQTIIILQSCFPIAEDMDMSNFSVDAKTLMSHINTINEWTRSLAKDNGLYYLNTSEALVNDSGFLKKQYDAGDGHHLTASAYLRMLEYIRTHGIKENK